MWGSVMSGNRLPPVNTKTFDAASAGALDLAVEHLLRGDLVVLPTDTVYGIAAHAFMPAAVAQLYTVKGRPLHKPIPMLLPNPDAVHTVCADVPPVTWRLAERFWPGALSMVLPRAAAVPDEITAGGATVAVRVPDHSLVRALCESLGAPLAVSSANRHGQPSPVTPGGAWDAMGGRVALVLDGGTCLGGQASTVLDLTVSPAVILRPGPVTVQALAALVELAV
jgi:L-threonylcarbamoyladenylate synthase